MRLKEERLIFILLFSITGPIPENCLEGEANPRKLFQTPPPHIFLQTIMRHTDIYFQCREIIIIIIFYQ